MSDLAHLTIVTGHLSRVPRDTIGDGEIRVARSLLNSALEHENGVAMMDPPFDRYSLRVERFGPALLCQIGTVDLASRRLDRCAIFGVARRPRDGRALWQRLLQEPEAAIRPKTLAMPPAPWCAAIPLLGIDAHRDLLAVLGDLEASIAWAWLDRCHDR